MSCQHWLGGGTPQTHGESRTIGSGGVRRFGDKGPQLIADEAGEAEGVRWRQQRSWSVG